MVEHGQSQRDIAKAFGCAQGTVSNTTKRLRERRSLYDAPKCGRPSTYTPRDERSMVRMATMHPKLTWKEIGASSASTSGVGTNGFSAYIATKVCNKVGIHDRIARRKPFLTRKQRKARLEWAQENENREWKKVLFTDEASIDIGERTTRLHVKRKAGKQCDDRMIQPTFRSNRQTLMVWGAVAYGQKSPLVRLPLKPSVSNGKVRTKAEGLNGQKYVDMVLSGPLVVARDHLASFNGAVGSDILVVEDGAPSHTSVLARDARQRLGVHQIKHPSNSPDLNAIEPIWLALKARVQKIKPVAATLDQLWQQIQQAWDDIPGKMIDDEISHMANRILEVKKSRGGHTNY